MPTSKPLLIAALLIACRPVGGWATTFVLADEQHLARQSDAVVLGRVEHVGARIEPGSGAIVTEVEIAIESALRGFFPQGTLRLREPGGEVGDRAERYYGTASYRVGEQVLAFATQRRDGSMGTTALAMGKYRVIRAGALSAAVRDFGEGVAVLGRQSAAVVTDPAPQLYSLDELLTSVGAAIDGQHLAAATPRSPAELAAKDPVLTGPFTFLGSPSRWFEPDSGLPVVYRVDALGDFDLGRFATQAVVNAALAAWSNIPSGTIELRQGDPIDPAPLSGCGGPNQIVFNDPGEQIADPYYCTGVLAMGGFCTTAETREVRGTSFRRITVGKIVFNDGWGICPTWNLCNVAEVLTHELGHTIGIGHSQQYGATMYAYANLDGRCGSLRADDVAAIHAMYPAGETTHDAVLLPVKPVSMRIPKGRRELTRILPVTVRNASAGTGTATFRLRAEDGTCPAGTVSEIELGADATDPGTAAIAAGRSLRGRLTLRLRSEAFLTPDRRTPLRCAILLRADATAPGNADPLPENNEIRVEIDVVDYNDGDVAATSVVSTQIASAPPVALRIAKRSRDRVTTQRIVLRNSGADGSRQAVRIYANDGDCPPGTAGAVTVSGLRNGNSEVVIPPRARRSARLTVRADREQFQSPFPGSPVRCCLHLQMVDSQGNVASTTDMYLDVTDDNDI